MPSRLIHCIYASAATRHFTTQELDALLRNARQKNARLDITGMLLHAAGSFFQVVEGPADAIDRLYASIENDPRHEQVTLIIREPIARRMFGDWSMGFHDVAHAALEGREGVNDFFSARAVTAIDAGRARKLLAGFRDGRWRKQCAALMPPRPPALLPQQALAA
ncbi:BLUF domain-containing protein [Azohydromonas aeria]|uniref:BLUF domain-containing protein n=1 Tax=Azohydromonas aeria TaxID=2590212 RepID=UPI0012F85D72|nr:BLUF domain-containing protein [Azohydromonas aeria]